MSAILSETEIAEITGYKRHAAQVMELRRQGFFRARRGPVSGHVIVERQHYEAICGGARLSAANEPKVREQKSREATDRVPQVRAPRLRAPQIQAPQVPQVRTPKLHRVV